MYSFKNDYSEGAHPKILEGLMKSNYIQEEGYSLDAYTKEAISKIKKLISSQCDIHLISGGTQTNLLAICSFLRPHEACIAASTGHIATHETGAIEATGHKVITTDSTDGKLSPALIEPILKDHHFEHMVKPKLVYISNPTELGTVYSKEELRKLYEFCQSKNLQVYADGARLGCAIDSSDVSLKDMYDFTDAFFIGGTKNGALLGEALVIKNMEVKEEFRYLIKQKGALLAKGRILGIQFNELFTDNLYFDLAAHANSMANFMADELKKLNVDFLIESNTNQIFPIIKNDIIDKLLKNFSFYIWQEVDKDHSAIRLITSWATSKEAVENFINAYKKENNA